MLRIVLLYIVRKQIIRLFISVTDVHCVALGTIVFSINKLLGNSLKGDCHILCIFLSFEIYFPIFVSKIINHFRCERKC